MPHAPLVSGSRIVNSRTGSPGTLGFIGVSPQGDRFVVSCYHVLGRVRGSPELPSDGEAIWHTAELESDLIAQTDVSMMKARFDVAAAALLPGIAVSADIASLGPIRGTIAAEEGMRIRKFGAETGLTTGVITYASDSLIEITADPDAPEEYVLSDHGDSGALWVTPEGAAVAMHFQGRDRNRAFARPVLFVMAELGLQILTIDSP